MARLGSQELAQALETLSPRSRKERQTDDDMAEESGTTVPETWDTIQKLPEMPTPERAVLCCERCVGIFVVGLLIGMCVLLTCLITSAQPTSSSSIFCRYLIFTEAAIALTFLFSLQYLGLGVIRRSPENCFPLPEEIAQRLRMDQRADALKAGDQAVPPKPLQVRMLAAVDGLNNIQDFEGGKGVYCVRCLLWRSETGHHCSECQRCVPDFDHHCGVLGCCVNGTASAFTGNMWMFVGLISMAAVGFATVGLSLVLCLRNSVSLQPSAAWHPEDLGGVPQALNATRSKMRALTTSIVMPAGGGGIAGLPGNIVGADPVGNLAASVARRARSRQGTQVSPVLMGAIRAEFWNVAFYAGAIFVFLVSLRAFSKGFMWFFYDRHAGRRRARPASRTAKRAIPL